MATIRVHPEAFDVGREIAFLSADRTDIGGLGCFVGLVRGNTDGVSLAALTLEHYPGMTERALAIIAATAEQRWSLLGCTIIHRIGRLPPGEPIVLVLTAAAHRGPALDATAFLIDWLKTKAPFWKSEESIDGTARWVAARADDDVAAAKWDQA
ncbi:MAG: molybdenum cofactor biosynthesis protein MoaE, partial [Pseudomonadota bacterium]|nr:molybdenum cofactor biosynthesis protein MoaE [Pseudomonadota bacterium]